MTNPSRPGELVLPQPERERLRHQVRDLAPFGAIFEGFRSHAEALVARPPQIPTGKARAFFESCPDDNALLVFDPYAPQSHVCSKCGRKWSGERYDQAWKRQMHAWLQERLIECGIVHAIAGGETYATAVRDALMHYATRWDEYPIENNLLGPTSIFQSTYLEAFWLHDIVVAYDLTRESPAYAPADHLAIRALFYASCATIRSYDEGRSNRQAFNNVGLGAVALLYSDAELTDHVLRGPHGYEWHMRHSLLADGLWYEGENYHFATLHHLLNLAELCRQRGIDLYHGSGGLPALKPMFDGPLGAMLPDLTFPARKDGWFGRGIKYYREVYELAYARYGEERYGGLLAHAYAADGGERGLGWRAFLWARPDLPDLPVEDLRPTASEPMPGTGVAVLRAARGSRYASLEYGHYGGGHGHPDRLHLSFFADGEQWFLDPGTGWYHVPELGWYRSTLAHNTVVVDGLSQSPAVGKLTAFGEAGGVRAAQATADGSYIGVRQRRTLVLGDDFLFDAFDVDCDEERQIDWVLHSRHALAGEPGELVSAPELGTANGYEFLSDQRRAPTRSLDAVFNAAQARLRTVQLGESAVYTAAARGITFEEDRPFRVTIARRRAERTRFVTVHLSGPAAGTAVFLEETPGAYRLDLGGRRHYFWLDDDPGIAYGREDSAGRLLAAFARGAARAGGLAAQSDWPLESFAVEETDGALRCTLPRSFGSLTVAGSAGDLAVEGLPEGARLQRSDGRVTVSQPPGEALRTSESGPACFYAGSPGVVDFEARAYGTEPGSPRLQVPAGWQLLDLRQAGRAAWEARLQPPAEPGSGRIEISYGSARLTVEAQVIAPLATAWRVSSGGGRPRLELTVSELAGESGALTAEVVAPWLAEAAGQRELPLAANGRVAISLDLPLTPTKPQPLPPLPAGHDLGGLGGNAGEHEVAVILTHRTFRGTTRARLPLAWASPQGGSLVRLDRAEQAYWADRPWGGPDDASASARLAWDEDGLRLEAEVRDDRHVSDASSEDPYENDSIQIYLDARQELRGDPHFTPGVAAFILAPDGERERVAVHAIAGNREISNRGARADWLTTAGITAVAEPAHTGYRIEARLPWSSLGIHCPSEGAVLGFDLALSDNDGTWYRNTQLVWSGSRGRRCYIRGSYHDPAEYGYLIIGGGA